MRKILEHLGAFSLGPIVSAFLGFLTVPIITYFITPDEYGKSSMFVPVSYTHLIRPHGEAPGRRMAEPL